MQYVLYASDTQLNSIYVNIINNKQYYFVYFNIIIKLSWKRKIIIIYEDNNINIMMTYLFHYFHILFRKLSLYNDYLVSQLHLHTKQDSWPVLITIIKLICVSMHSSYCLDPDLMPSVGSIYHAGITWVGNYSMCHIHGH